MRATEVSFFFFKLVLKKNQTIKLKKRNSESISIGIYLFTLETSKIEWTKDRVVAIPPAAASVQNLVSRALVIPSYFIKNLCGK